MQHIYNKSTFNKLSKMTCYTYLAFIGNYTQCVRIRFTETHPVNLGRNGRWILENAFISQDFQEMHIFPE